MKEMMEIFNANTLDEEEYQADEREYR